MEPMTTTHLMGSALGVDHKPAEPDVKTVETTATRSSTLSADIPPEIARPSKPEVASKPVITRQPSVVAPLTQIRTDEGSSFLLSTDSSELGSSTAVSYPFHSETGNGNRNEHDVIITKVGAGLRGYRLPARTFVLAFYFLREAKISTGECQDKVRRITSAGWHLTLCDPI